MASRLHSENWKKGPSSWYCRTPGGPEAVSPEVNMEDQDKQDKLDQKDNLQITEVARRRSTKPRKSHTESFLSEPFPERCG